MTPEYRCGCQPPLYCPTHRPNPFQRDIDHWNETGRCLRHFSLDVPPRFCEQCGKPWSQVIDGREGRKRRRSVTLDARATPTRRGHE